MYILYTACPCTQCDFLFLPNLRVVVQKPYSRPKFPFKIFFVRICGDVKKYSHYIQSRVSQGLAVN